MRFSVLVLTFLSTATRVRALVLNVVDAGVASAAKLRPNDNKDAFFTSAPSFFGVFDGVSQCPESREYARLLAIESRAALRSSDPTSSWDDQVRGALQQATQKADRLSGSSTALLVRMDLDQPQPQACTYAMGDTTCVLLRQQKGSTVVGDCSAVTYHDNGAPFQFGGAEWKSDGVGDGVIERFDVGVGDVLVCCSDGVTGNLALNDIAQIVDSCAAQSAEALAQVIVFEAQKRNIIADDITAVAIRLGEGEWVGGEKEIDASTLKGLAEPKEERVSVRLEKPLGLMLDEVISGGAGVEVGSMVADSNAERCGRLESGDKLLQVASTNVADMSFDDVMQVLIDAPSPVDLSFSRTVYPALPVPTVSLGGSPGGGGAPAAPSAPPTSARGDDASTSTTDDDLAGQLKGAFGGFASGLFDKAKSAAAEQAAKAAEAAKAAAEQAIADMKDKKK